MPSIEQYERVDGNTAALSSSMVFDKFKDAENGKDSDSDESFHLAVESDEDENLANGVDKETEDEILNKFESCSPDEDGDVEDKLLAEDDNIIVCKTEINVQCDEVDKNYADDNVDGEFKSLYEDEVSTEENVGTEDNCDEMEVVDEAETSDEEANQDTERNDEALTEDEPEQQPEEKADDEEQNSTETTPAEVQEEETTEVKLEPETTFKVPEPVAVDENKQEDESDLLDISMIRETEEDDACAIEEAIKETIEEKESELDEKTDDDLNESMDATDNEKEDNDSRMDMDDQNDDSRMSSIGVSESSKDGTSDDCTITMDDDSGNADDTVKETEAVEPAEVEDNEEKIETAESATQVDETSEDISEKTEEKPEDTSQIIEPEEELDEKIDENVVTEVVSEAVEENKEEPDTPIVVKRPLVEDFGEVTPAKKPRLSDEVRDTIDTPAESMEPPPKTKHLSAFSEFVKAKNLKNMCSRSDLEQFVLQKVAEAITNVSKDAAMLQMLKSYENKIDRMKKDMTTLLKQCRDLEIVNKKLMSDLKIQKRPLVPLKITRSVGLQVRLNPVAETVTQQRKRQSVVPAQTPSPQKTTPTIVKNRVSTATPRTLPSPHKSPASSQGTVLAQALQKRLMAKRTTPVAKKVTIAPKTPGSGVIDLTDEDDNRPAVLRAGSSTAPGTPKPVPKTNSSVAKKIVSPQMTVAQGIRLAPGSVLTSTAGGGQQMLYVLPTTSGGQQKVALLMSPNNSIPGQLNGAVVQNKTINIRNAPVPSPSAAAPLRPKHPAPLPAPPRISLDPKLKPLLPKPILTIKKIDTGIILQWKMPYNLELYEGIASYQLYAYQETTAQPSTDMWRKVGDVKALALPMACTLTQFADKNKYYFAVRSVDVHKRIGAFSDPEQINL